MDNEYEDAHSQATSLAPDTSIIADTTETRLTDTEPVRVAGQLYYLGIDIAKKRKRRSWIYEHGLELILASDRKKTFWSCSLCKNTTTMYSTHSTDHAADHLKKIHRMLESGPMQVKTPFSIAKLSTEPSSTHVNTVVTRLQVDVFKRLLVRWIAIKHISFSQVENPEFRDFIVHLSIGLAAFLPTSGTSIKSWLIQEYDRYKSKIKDILAGVSNQIHITFDTWTSPNMHAFVACNAHFVYDGSLHTVLLGLRALIGSHSGENTAGVLVPLIQEYGIQEKVGYFVLDNASNNDTCINHILASIQPNEIPRERRLRCFGHVLNLAASQFLFGKHSEAFEIQAGVAAQLGDEIKERDLWREKGPIGKLHKLVIHIRRTPQRREQFLRLQTDDQLDNDTPLMVIQDNETRWNSKYNIAIRAMKLKDRLQLYTIRWQGTRDGQISEEDVLTRDDWDELKEIVEILRPFQILTLRLQGRTNTSTHGAIWEVLPSIEYLFVHLKSVKDRLSVIGNMKSLMVGINLAIIKLEEYYALLDDSAVAVASLVLNPRHKWKYLERKWTGPKEKGWLRSSKTRVQALWLSYSGILSPSTGTVFNPCHSYREKEFDILEEFMAPDPDEIQVENNDEYERYCKTSTVDCGFNLIEWWTVQQIEYPRLSRMALNLLSIPAMADECERVFSNAKILITDRRNKLTVDSIESNECLRAWYTLPILKGLL